MILTLLTWTVTDLDGLSLHTLTKADEGKVSYQITQWNTGRKNIVIPRSYLFTAKFVETCLYNVCVLNILKQYLRRLQESQRWRGLRRAICEWLGEMHQRGAGGSCRRDERAAFGPFIFLYFVASGLSRIKTGLNPELWVWCLPRLPAVVLERPQSHCDLITQTTTELVWDTFDHI